MNWVKEMTRELSAKHKGQWYFFHFFVAFEYLKSIDIKQIILLKIVLHLPHNNLLIYISVIQ